MVVINKEFITIGKIDKKSVCQCLGYDSSSRPRERLSSLITEYSGEAHHFIDPSYSYTIRDVEWIVGSTVAIEGSIIFDSTVIAHMLKKCSKVAILIVTIGDKLEEMTSQLAQDGLIYQASVLDAIGSVAVEKVADCIQKRILEEVMNDGFTIGRRFSPGYCDWDISQQGALFKAMEGDLAGVSLNESGLMTPQKSISGIIGIGRSGGGLESYNPCRTCNNYCCSGRR